jgi:hypothetical protein
MKMLARTRIYKHHRSERSGVRARTTAARAPVLINESLSESTWRRRYDHNGGKYNNVRQALFSVGHMGPPVSMICTARETVIVSR